MSIHTCFANARVESLFSASLLPENQPFHLAEHVRMKNRKYLLLLRREDTYQGQPFGL
jgi:hypothetical protein